MKQELKEANKNFKKWWKKDLKHIKKHIKQSQKKLWQIDLIENMCYCFYLRGWGDRGENERQIL